MNSSTSSILHFAAALTLGVCYAHGQGFGQQPAASPTPAAAPVPAAPIGQLPGATPAPANPGEAPVPFPPVAIQGGGYGGSSGGGYGYVRSTGSASMALDNFQTGFRTGSKRDTVAPVVVDFTSKDPATVQEMEEDLLVMSHILDQSLERNLGEQAPPTKMGVPMVYTGGGRSARGLYLEGFGALFMLKVNMPLLAPPAVKQVEAKPPVDSEWESARREVFGAETSSESITVSGTPEVAAFDQEQLDTLKRTLIDSLKNAGNIRHLKPDDFVSIAVFGQAAPQIATVEYSVSDESTGEKVSTAKSSTGTSNRTGKSSKRNSASASVGVNFGTAKAGKITSTKGTVLTLRAKKADVAAFAAGQIGTDEFAQRVTTNAYPGSGNGIASVNSWIQSGRAPAPAVRY